MDGGNEFFFFKQKTYYEIYQCDWSSDVCSSDLKIKIYCEDLEKTIDEDGCYDAKGSMICQACLKKPNRKKINRVNKDKKIS